MRALQITLFIAVMLSSQACNRDLDLPKMKAKKKIVLVGELEAGENILFRAGQSIPVTAGSTLLFQVIENLSVTVKGPSNKITQLSGAEDSLTPSLYTIPFTADYKIQPGNTYAITATQPEMGTATANIVIPGPYTAAITGYADANYGYDNTIKFDIRISDPQEENYYVMECLKQEMDVLGFFLYQGTWLDISANKSKYDELKKNGTVTEKFDTIFYNKFNRQYLYTDDVNTDNLHQYNSFSSFNRILLTDNSFQNKEYNTHLYVVKNNDPNMPKGRLLVMVKSVSKDYYEYLRQYAQNVAATLTPFAMSSSAKGNIEGGLGILGGVYKQQFVYVFDKWDF